MNKESVQFPQPPGRIRLHHIGYVVASIDKSAESFASSLGATWNGKIDFDPLQKVRVTFLQGATATDSLIELVEPGCSGSPVSRFLKQGGGLHHLCYEVDDLEAQLEYCKSVGTIIIRKPVPAIAFGGRRIAWGLTAWRLLVEYLEETSLLED